LYSTREISLSLREEEFRKQFIQKKDLINARF